MCISHNRKNKFGKFRFRPNISRSIISHKAKKICVISPYICPQWRRIWSEFKKRINNFFNFRVWLSRVPVKKLEKHSCEWKNYQIVLCKRDRTSYVCMCICLWDTCLSILAQDVVVKHVLQSEKVLQHKWLYKLWKGFASKVAE